MRKTFQATYYTKRGECLKEVFQVFIPDNQALNAVQIAASHFLQLKVTDSDFKCLTQDRHAVQEVLD